MREPANGSRLDNWAEGFIKVDTWLLVETFGDKTGFVTINEAISFAFEAEYPIATNNVHVRGGRNKSPNTVAEKGIKFKIHGITSCRVLGSCRVGGRFDVY